MKCHACEKELEQIEFRGIKVDECPECHGRWFDRGELRKAKDNTDEDLCWLDFDPFSKEANDFSEMPLDGKGCPKCGNTMTTLTYANSRVVIDQCNECQGIWLDDGEFKKIIAYLEDVVTSETASEYVVDSLKQLMEIVKGPEGAKSEIKDFLVVLKLLKLRFAVEHSKIAATTNKIYEYLPFL